MHSPLWSCPSPSVLVFLCPHPSSSAPSSSAPSASTPSILLCLRPSIPFCPHPLLLQPSAASTYPPLPVSSSAASVLLCPILLCPHPSSSATPLPVPTATAGCFKKERSKDSKMLFRSVQSCRNAVKPHSAVAGIAYAHMDLLMIGLMDCSTVLLLARSRVPQEPPQRALYGGCPWGLSPIRQQTWAALRSP